jgi:hypothetical protein
MDQSQFQEQDHAQAAQQAQEVTNQQGDLSQSQTVTFTTDQANELVQRISSLEASLHQANTQIAQMNTTRVPSATIGVHRYKAANPTPFTGKPEALSAWIEQVNLHIKIAGVEGDEVRLDVAKQFVSTNVMRWIQTLDHVQGWNDLCTRMLTYYQVTNEEDHARKRLAMLKQRGSIKSYTNEFNNLILKLPMLTTEDKIFFYKEGLKPDVRMQVSIARPQSLIHAKEVADMADDILYNKGRQSRNEFQDASGNDAGTDNRMNLGSINTRRLSDKEKETYMREGRCFTCGKTGHRSRDCEEKQQKKKGADKSDDDSDASEN